MAMIARRFGLVVLAVAGYFAWTGCQPAARPPVANQKGRPSVQKKARSTGRRIVKLDEDANRTRLLMIETVQKDLGLTNDQIGKLKHCAKIGGELYREFRVKWREIFSPSQHFRPEEFEARDREFQVLFEDYKSKGKELQTKALAMLTPSQSQRLTQIRIQVAIPDALARPEIIKALDISKEQRENIRTLTDRMEKRTLAEQPPDLHALNPTERRQKELEFVKKSDKIQAEATKPILDVLTPQQRAKFDKLQGKKIEVRWSDDELIPQDTEF